MATSVPTHVYSVLINLEGENLLVPNAAVAEVAGQDQFTPREGKPRWYIGNMRWQSRELPVISVEAMLGHPVPEMQRKSRLVALNAPAQAAAFAILSRSYPMIVTLNEMALQPEALGENEPDKLIYARVRVANRQAMIPDLDGLAALVRKVS